MLGEFLRSLIIDDVFHSFLGRPIPRNADFGSHSGYPGFLRGIHQGSTGDCQGLPRGVQGRFEVITGRETLKVICLGTQVCPFWPAGADRPSMYPGLAGHPLDAQKAKAPKYRFADDCWTCLMMDF